jgi:hypothetical protein
MSRTRNANELRDKLVECFREGARIPEFNEKPRVGAGPDEHEAYTQRRSWLEHHAREFVIDHILEALNWVISPARDAQTYRAQNLAPEVSIDSVGEETRRRMDYLGFNSETTKPLVSAAPTAFHPKECS